MLSALEALSRLEEGNRRFASGVRSLATLMTQGPRDGVVEAQTPFAVILGCSDSRVPVEMVFDQGLGELFVIRVAGNIVAPSQIGSVEFAAAKFDVKLVVVLGHSHCGAIHSTLGALRSPSEGDLGPLASIVDRIRPSVAELMGVVEDDDELARKAVRANVRASTSALRHGSETLEHLVGSGELLVVGAEYSLETGEVDFFDGMPARTD